LKAFDLPQVASALAPRPVLFVNPVGPDGGPMDRETHGRYAAIPTVDIRALQPTDDPIRHVADWFTER
jgi:hypothetical protein